MREGLTENLIKKLYEWGFAAKNIAAAFGIRTSFISELTKGVTPTEYGICNDDGWLMEELMRMGITKQEVSELFGTDEVFIDTYIKKYRSKENEVEEIEVEKTESNKMTKTRHLKLKMKPIAKARPRLGRNGTYTPKTTVEYEKAVQFAYQSQFKNEEPFEKPVQIEIDFYFQVPKSYTKKQRLQFAEGDKPHTKRPDLDNLVKAVTDALNGFAYKDDSQIYSMVIQKWETLEESNIDIKIQED